MNGAESLLRTLVDAGLQVCFANPGTTEMPLVRALEQVPELRTVLCLFEGVCTGAADGYARMADKPGLTLLHLGPGFANGIAYLHDARRARSAIVNLIGDHATWHLAADAPLTSDIESLARPVSVWVRRSQSADDLAADAAEAVSVAATKPGQIATLIVPHDYQLAPASGAVTPRTAKLPTQINDETVATVVDALRRDTPKALFLGGYALRERGLQAAARIAAVTGCKLICETFPTRWERGVGTPILERLPYFPEPAIAALAPYQTIVLAGAKSPVSFFGYPGVPSYFISPEQQQVVLAKPEDDVVNALQAVAEALGAPPVATNSELQIPPRPTGKLTPEAFSAAVACVLPENAIVMDESNTSAGPFCVLSQSAPRHSYLTQPGGAIGLGLPCATGAALACPDRPVINLQADGSGMYTVQALWTQARENLNVKNIICNNRSYRILGLEMLRAGVKEFSPQAQSLMSLASPALDWVHLAQGMGVSAVRVETAEDLTRELERALATPGPCLLEAIL
ncbi:MAG: acetolactate synthase large subunit [Acidobacteria bacterium]|nr:acetolactate synthase large subunit [Acidobacteriota bacterium]